MSVVGETSARDFWDRLCSRLDGFTSGDQTRLDVYDESFIDEYMWTFRWVKERYFRFTIENFERIPNRGGALLILNHGLFSIDPFLLGYELWAKKRRLLRGLTDRRAYMVPYVRQFFRKIGVVEGHRETAIALLGRGELCFAMPGGGLEWGKPSSKRYQLLWEDHVGFVITALRARVPIIPVVTIGIDDIYNIPLRLRTGLLGAKTRLPLFVYGWGPLPRPVKLTQYVGKPIHFAEMGHTAEDAGRPEIVARLQAHVRQVMTGMIEEGLALRASLWR